MLRRSVDLHGRRGIELLGEGDVLQPWLDFGTDSKTEQDGQFGTDFTDDAIDGCELLGAAAVTQPGGVTTELNYLGLTRNVAFERRTAVDDGGTDRSRRRTTPTTLSVTG